MRKKHGAQDELEKAEGALRVAQERLDVVTQILPKKEAELEDLIVTNELKGYKKPAIARTQSEIAKLQTEREVLQKTISALQKRLPDLQRSARIETAEVETVSAYRQALDGFKAMLEGPPASDGMVAGIEALEQYCRDIYESQDRYRRTARKLNELMLAEGISSIGEISQEQLFSDKQDVSQRNLELKVEGLSALAQRIINIQTSLSLLTANRNALLDLVRPPEPPFEPEFSPCGKYKIAKNNWGHWCLYVKVSKFNDMTGRLEDTWAEKLHGIHKPSFPSDQLKKKKPEPANELPPMSHAVDIAHVGRKVDPDTRK